LAHPLSGKRGKQKKKPGPQVLAKTEKQLKEQKKKEKKHGKHADYLGKQVEMKRRGNRRSTSGGR